MKARIKLLVALIVLGSFCFVSCATHVYGNKQRSQHKNRHIYQEHRAGGKFVPDGETNEHAELVVTAVGIGVAPTGVDMNSAQGEVLAIRAAEADAKRKLFEKIFGLWMFGKYRTSQNALQKDKITSTLRGYIEGASVGMPGEDDEQAILANCYKGGIATIPMSINISNKWLVEMSEAPVMGHPLY